MNYPGQAGGGNQGGGMFQCNPQVGPQWGGGYAQQPTPQQQPSGSYYTPQLPPAGINGLSIFTYGYKITGLLPCNLVSPVHLTYNFPVDAANAIAVVLCSKHPYDLSSIRIMLNITWSIASSLKSIWLIYHMHRLLIALTNL